jgi:hypothetical protein
MMALASSRAQAQTTLAKSLPISTVLTVKAGPAGRRPA